MPALSVAIVGVGPRGLSVLERLLIRLRRERPPVPVGIWVIDPVEHGPGAVWRTAQPDWLAMNATASEVTIQSPDSHLAGGRSDDASSLSTWTSGPAYPGAASGPLIRALLADGAISEYVNVDPVTGDRFATGGLAVTRAPFRWSGRAGAPIPTSTPSAWPRTRPGGSPKSERAAPGRAARSMMMPTPSPPTSSGADDVGRRRRERYGVLST